MFIILVLLVILIGSIIWAALASYHTDAVPSIIEFVSGIVLLCMLVAIPFARADAHDHLAQRDALQATYDDLRQHPGYEMATIGREIAEWNAWLASAKYWHKTQWSWYWPEEVETAQPIK